MASLSFDPLIPPTLWVTLALVGAGVLTWYGYARPATVPRLRWAVVLALMAASQALVMIILLNPTWVEPVQHGGRKPVLNVLVDVSASMATPDGSEGKTRFQAAAELVREAAAELNRRFDVRIITYSETTGPKNLEELEGTIPDGRLTDLAGALHHSFDEGAASQVMMLLSDGIHNAGGGPERVLEAAHQAKARACPIYTHTYGGAAAVQDLAVDFRSSQELAFVNQKITLTTRVKHQGLAGRIADLTLVHEGKVVEKRQAPLAQDSTAEIRFDVKQTKPGLYRYEVRAEPLPGEKSKANNASTVLLRVVDKAVRLLLLEGKPYWDGKFLMRTLLMDPSIEVDSIVLTGANRFHRRTFTRQTGLEAGSPPFNEEWSTHTDFSELFGKGEKLAGIQILVLGRNADVYLTDPVLQQIRNWLARHGGSLVCYRGQPTAQVNQRLGQLLPVNWSPARESRFQMNFTDRGRDLRWIPTSDQEPSGALMSRLPTLATGAQPETPKPLAVVLAQAVDRESPVVTYQPYGAGRVVVIEGAGMWRWAFLPPQHQQLEEVYRMLWHGLLRWLVSSVDLLPGQKAALRSDKVNFGITESASATLLMREEAVPGKVPAVELRGGNLEKPLSITPVPVGEDVGTYRVDFGKLPEGKYQARLSDAKPEDPTVEAAFDVRGHFEEQLELKARPELMARIAQESGGAVLTGSTAREMVTGFQEHLDRSRPPQVRRLSAWDRWWVLLGALGIWCAAWILRRSAGLI